MKQSIVAALAFCFLSSTFAKADPAAEINSFLQDFQKDSFSAMNRHPVKHDANGQVVSEVESKFSAEQIARKEFITLRDQTRQQHCSIVGGARVCLKDVLPGKAPYLSNDLAENLVDSPNTMLRNIYAMDISYKSAKLAITPWSDDYWGIYKGITAARYADPNFPGSPDWTVNHDYYTSHDYFADAHKDLFDIPIDTLSPAEKYDLLVGSMYGTLTQNLWREGQQLETSVGHVEHWMGICHGWSPASYMLPHPKHSIVLTAPDNTTKITFYPADIKALGSLLFAKGNAPQRYIGGRCNIQDPDEESSGRIIDQDCFDTNPGTWHMAIVNQIGMSKRSFVMDATYDYEVWNQPVQGYSYRYFNPQSMNYVNDAQSATVPFSQFSHDKFRSHRGNNISKVIGIAMDVTYVVEVMPVHEAVDNGANDLTRTVTYLYDLELDASGNILGGEWYQNAHPDFMWTFAPGTVPKSLGDIYLKGSWNNAATTSIPADWRSIAEFASGSEQPLAPIVQTLFTLSQ